MRWKSLREDLRLVFILQKKVDYVMSQTETLLITDRSSAFLPWAL